jgi:hypothetical protein
LKVEFNNKNDIKKYANNWRVNSTLFIHQWIIEEIREEMKRFLEVNENENTTYHIQWDTAKQF